jgi:hypothetical protein
MGDELLRASFNVDHHRTYGGRRDIYQQDVSAEHRHRVSYPLDFFTDLFVFAATIIFRRDISRQEMNHPSRCPGYTTMPIARISVPCV